jgi:hypothetical protein
MFGQLLVVPVVVDGVVAAVVVVAADVLVVVVGVAVELLVAAFASAVPPPMIAPLTATVASLFFRLAISFHLPSVRLLGHLVKRRQLGVPCEQAKTFVRVLPSVTLSRVARLRTSFERVCRRDDRVASRTEKPVESQPASGFVFGETGRARLGRDRRLRSRIRSGAHSPIGGGLARPIATARLRRAMNERPLSGGRVTPGVVRVGGTVRRPARPNSQFVQALLTHLQERGFDAVPCHLGSDEQGREVFSFIEGHVPPDLDASFPDEGARVRCSPDSPFPRRDGRLSSRSR